MFVTRASSVLFVQPSSWPSGQRVGLTIPRSRVRVPLWPLVGFVLGLPEFKSSAKLVNSRLVASLLGFLIIIVWGGVPVK